MAIIANRYDIQQEIGQGGMGTVYLANDTHSQQTVAIKRLKSNMTTAELIERFKREGEALCELNHPNIVKLLDTIQENDNHYLVMEYVSGGDLAKLVHAQQLPLETIIRYGIDLADALTRAHKLDIIHRDLKPANILIANDGTLRLTDFGIAQLGSKERVTDTDAIVGTIGYLPPEAFDGRGLDTRSDIWAFGVILFEMVSGQRPFVGQTLFETIQQITTAPIPDLEARNPDVPIALVDLIYRMLERDPQSRIASVRHIGAELEDILHGRASQQPRTRRFDTPAEALEFTTIHNLPNQTTPFVGREAEVTALSHLLEDTNNRLITIIAPGGMGKTRLSLEVASRNIHLFQHGVFFVEMAPLTQVDDIITAVAEAFGYQLLFGESSVKQQILDFLKHRSLLIIFDNFEHLLTGASLVSDILKDASNIRILTTSRQRLSQAGETLYHLSGLDFADVVSVDEARNNGSIQLFLQSAKRVRPDFELSEDNLEAVTCICQHVQGMPLGIILAASWLAILSPEEILQEITNGLELLETDETILPDRQRSVRGIFDYSWDMMSPDERQVFMKLSIFRGGFSREGAQHIASANLRILMSLVNKSLIRRNTTNGRYEIHELLRQYAEDQLNRYQLSDKICRAHLEFYVDLAKQAYHQLRYANQEHWFTLLGDELDNLRVALDWALAHNVQDALDIMASTRDFWFYQGHHLEGYTWLSKIREQEHLLDDMSKGRLLYSQSIIAWALQQIDDAEQLALQSIAILKDSPNSQHLGWAQVMLASIIGIKEGRYDEAIKISNQAIELLSQINDKAGLAQVYNTIGNAHEFAGQYDLAIEAFEQSREIAQETGELRRVAMNQANLARFKLENGDSSTALALLKETLRLDYQLGFQYMLISDLNGFAHLLTKVNQFYDALLMISATNSLSDESGIKIQPAEYVWWEKSYQEIKTQLNNEDYQRAWQQGQSMTFEQAMAYALAIELDT